MQYNPNSLWAGHRSAVRRGSGVTGRGAGSWQLAHHRAPHPAPRSFQKKAAPAAVQTPRFQKIASATVGVEYGSAPLPTAVPVSGPMKDTPNKLVLERVD